MARRRGNGFCGSAEHLVNRRAFLGGTALATAGLASDMTSLDVLRTPALANQLQTGYPALAGRGSKSTGNLGPETQSSHRWSIWCHFNQPGRGSDFRVAAKDGTAIGKHCNYPFVEHEGWVAR